MANDELQRWARFGVDQDGIKYIPIGGTCLIVYLLSRKGDSLLVGKVDGKGHSDYWKDEAIYLHRPHIWVDKWFVPCGFLHFGEDPQHRAETIVKENINGKTKALKLREVVSYIQKSEYYPGYHHWHVDFVYDMEGLKLGSKPAWWDSLEYVPLKELNYGNIGMAGSEVLKSLGLIRA